MGLDTIDVISRGAHSRATNGRHVLPTTALDTARANLACAHRQAEIATDERMEAHRKWQIQHAINARLVDRLLAIRLVAEQNPAVRAALGDLISNP